MKIVIADDSRVMRQLVVRTLRQAGFDGHVFVEAADGMEALGKIREHAPDLVLADWTMRVKTGIELLRELRATGDRVPFGFVTADGSPEVHRAAEAAGAMFVIAKPFTPEAFEDALSGRGVLTGSRRSPSAPPPRTSARSTDAPSRKQVKDLFEGLLARTVALSDAAPVVVDSRPRPTTAVYVDDRNRLASVALMDLPLTARVGAALGLLPRCRAEEAIAERDLPADLLENATEVLNVLAATVGEASGVHQRLHQTFGPDEEPPSDVLVRCTQLGARIDLRLDIAAYGCGTLSVLSAVG